MTTPYDGSLDLDKLTQRHETFRMPILELHRLTKRFGDFAAVDDLSLDIAAGEFLTLLGASGSGKTTTLRMIAGFEPPTSGEILMAGTPIAALPPFKRDINTVFQHYALFPHMSVRENIAYGLRMRRVPAAEREERVSKAIAMVKLDQLGARSPRQLSGGQQQRVALARALVNRPRVLLLDEPLGALDLKLRRRLQLELKRIQAEVGITFVYVTHDQEEALTMSDRIAVMHAGRVEQLGTPEELYERPTSRFVADFIGTTNLLHGEIVGETGGGTDIRLDSGELCRVRAGAGTVGGAIDVSLRPESIRLCSTASSADGDTAERAPSPPTTAGWAIHGTIEQAAYLGAAVQYQVRSRGGLALTALAPRTEARRSVGDPVALSWMPDEALVLGDRPAVVEET
jgi:spermidine/putrescine transport system ATP-binding protein